MKRLLRLGLSALLASVPVLAVDAGPAMAANGGPVVLTGIDAEDCGVGGHGPIGNYVTLVDSILANTSNGGDGILVIGANGSGPRDFWNAIGSGTGETVTFGNENSGFAGFQMLAVVGSAPETCSGLTATQNNVLAGRQADFADFVNGGGGLVGNTQANFSNQYAYIGGLGSFSSSSGDYYNIDPTAAGLAVGITDALDLCCWHNVFTQFPSFLQVLAYEAGTQRAAAIGGQQVVIPVGIELAPPTASNPAGTVHSLTATVKDGNNVPQPGVAVSFTVVSGPNTGQQSDPGECTANLDCTTDANGQVSWSYQSDGQIGTDTIQACFVNAKTGKGVCTSATAEWTNRPPTCDAVAPSQTELWPPNHKLVPVSLSGASDPDGDPVTLTVTSVTQDEPVNDIADGNTAPDAVLGSAANELSLRAERSGTGDGRVYRIGFTASDPVGASCTGTVAVVVPHDQSGSGATDSGDVYDSLVS